MRYRTLDALRGFALLNMILYHGLWDVVNIWGFNLPWFTSRGGYVWQQCICCTFILLSGFCFPFGRRKLKRGLTVLLCSAVITGVTIVLMPENLILFGVLTFLGSAMIITMPLSKVFAKINPYVGIIMTLSLFVLFKNVASGGLPNGWYANLFTAYMGLPPREFMSQDYFPLIPWLFLFWCGYFLYRAFYKAGKLEFFTKIKCRPFEWAGRHSLIIYMLHQPLLYLCILIIKRLF